MPWSRKRSKAADAVVPSYLAHRNIVLHDLRAIYFFIPKVACSSVKKICADLLKIDVDMTCSVEAVHEVDYPFVPRAELARHADYFKFAFVRNPWDRLVSCWSSKITSDPGRTDEHVLNGVYRCLASYPQFHAGMSFEAFARAVVATPDDKAEDHFRSQYLFLTSKDGEELCDFVGRFENLLADLAQVLRRLNVVDSIEVTQLNPSPRTNYVDYYSPELRDAVGQRFSEDIRRFNYSF